MMARLGELFADPDRTRSLAIAALEVLLAEPSVDPGRIAAIGYCFGGALALELGRAGADIKAIVGFHPGLTNVRPSDSTNIRGRVLMCIGADDPLIPPQDRIAFENEMRAAKVDWQVHLYGGVVHSFTHPRASAAGIPGIAYDERAAAHAWAMMCTLLGEVF
jgi:dienelactone hydrolase